MEIQDKPNNLDRKLKKLRVTVCTQFKLAAEKRKIWRNLRMIALGRITRC
jgi:hypothetical protein